VGYPTPLPRSFCTSDADPTAPFPIIYLKFMSIELLEKNQIKASLQHSYTPILQSFPVLHYSITPSSILQLILKRDTSFSRSRAASFSCSIAE
jgi:hypothetical protein